MQKKIVLIGGGHCNCQVLKLLKRLLPTTVKMTLITESPVSFYSGMLPGTVSTLYTTEELQVQLEPLAKWCKAEYVEQRVEKIIANENRVQLKDGSFIDYDVLVVNVGSRTRGGYSIPGVYENSLSTRPINDCLGKIEKKENELLASNSIPRVVICGAGAAGTELAFGFKARWSKVFKQDISVTLVGSSSTILQGSHKSTHQQCYRKLAELNIEIVHNEVVQSVEKDGVVMKSGNKLDCNVAIWATGADPQEVSAVSDLELMNGYFRVNNFLQSTSHPNVFAGGDCITMETYAAENFPPKAGVYAVREGPVIAQNVFNFINGKPLDEYVPQRQFLALLMTGDGKALGAKFGITMAGKWVWNMKDWIDRGFMQLFDPNNLFRDYKQMGTSEPLENNELFDDAKAELEVQLAPLRARVATMDALEAAMLLSCSEEETEFHERLMILSRMHFEKDFELKVVEAFKPPYYAQL